MVNDFDNAMTIITIISVITIRSLVAVITVMAVIVAIRVPYLYFLDGGIFMINEGNGLLSL